MDDPTLDAWLDDLAARQPTPGGGGAAALAAAVSAALVSMVSRYTTGEKWADVSDRMSEIAEQADILRYKAVSLMQSDTEAFAAVGAAYGLPKGSDNQKAIRNTAIQAALTAAAEPPSNLVEIGLTLLVLSEELVTTANSNLISDIAVAASYAKSALESAIVNIEINALLIEDKDKVAALTTALQSAEQALPNADSIIATVRQRMRD